MSARTMIIDYGDGRKEFNKCPACPRFVPHGDGLKTCDKSIPVYHSVQDAMDAGWRRTTDIDYCPPGEGFVWVCPDN